MSIINIGEDQDQDWGEPDEKSVANAFAEEVHALSPSNLKHPTHLDRNPSSLIRMTTMTLEVMMPSSSQPCQHHLSGFHPMEVQYLQGGKQSMSTHSTLFGYNLMTQDVTDFHLDLSGYTSAMGANVPLSLSSNMFSSAVHQVKVSTWEHKQAMESSKYISVWLCEY